MEIESRLLLGIVVTALLVIPALPGAIGSHGCGAVIELSKPAGAIPGELGPSGYQWFLVFLEQGEYIFAYPAGGETGVEAMYDGHCMTLADSDGYVLFFSPVSYRAPASGYYSFYVDGFWGADYILTYVIVD